jgi:hypothetical protein
MKRNCFFAMSIFLFGASLLAQSQPAATESPLSIAVGAEFSTYNSDWGCQSSSAFKCWSTHLLGIGGFVDANHVFWKFGAEGEARFLHWGGPGGGVVQSNYLFGPRYQVYKVGNLVAQVKGLVGKGMMTFPAKGGTGSYFALAPGGAAEYRLTNKLTLRGDYEYQWWPGFSGKPNLPNHGLTPNGFSFGFSYRVLR